MCLSQLVRVRKKRHETQDLSHSVPEAFSALGMATVPAHVGCLEGDLFPLALSLSRVRPRLWCLLLLWSPAKPHWPLGIHWLKNCRGPQTAPPLPLFARPPTQTLARTAQPSVIATIFFFCHYESQKNGLYKTMWLTSRHITLLGEWLLRSRRDETGQASGGAMRRKRAERCWARIQEGGAFGWSQVLSYSYTETHSTLSGLCICLVSTQDANPHQAEAISTSSQTLLVTYNCHADYHSNSTAKWLFCSFSV